MATLETRINNLASAIGTDVKALRATQGNLATLPTTAKANLVAAIAEIYGMLGNAGAVINDSAGDGTTDKTWSADKIGDTVTAAINTLRTELRAGAGAALDTFAEVAAQLALDESAASALATAVANRVRFDAAQTLTTPQKVQARANIAAYGADEIGNPDANLVVVYTTARDA